MDDQNKVVSILELAMETEPYKRIKTEDMTDAEKAAVPSFFCRGGKKAAVTVLSEGKIYP